MLNLHDLFVMSFCWIAVGICAGLVKFEFLSHSAGKLFSHCLVCAIGAIIAGAAFAVAMLGVMQSLTLCSAVVAVGGAVLMPMLVELIVEQRNNKMRGRNSRSQALTDQPRN